MFVIRVSHKGDFRKTEKFFKAMLSRSYLKQLRKYGEQGVAALQNATPKDSGQTANAWKYRIEEDSDNIRIVWFNEHIVDGAPVAIMLQYGHATGNGGYVAGRDYINPAIRHIFDDISDNVKAEVSRA